MPQANKYQTPREKRRAAQAARRRNQYILIGAVGVVVVVALAFVIINRVAKANQYKGMTTTSSGLKYQDLTVGTGREVKDGDTIAVEYTGWLEDGTVFDTSVNRGQPFTFTVGQGAVIKGWDEGVVGMKLGGKRKLVIPPDLAYGSQGYGTVIPPNATLIFEISLLAIK
jgi:FKBP-type peptidyl-prolyl cis-trans isomerase FkpA